MMGSSAFPLLPGEKATGIQLSAATMKANGGDLQQLASSDPRVPLFNLSILGRKMDSLSRFLSQSVLCHASLGGDQLQMVSTEIATAVQQIIVNGAALLASSQADSPAHIPRKLPDPIDSFCLDLKAPVRKASDLVVFDVDGPDRSIASKSVIPAHNLAKSPDPIDPFRITNASVSMMDLKSPVSRRNLAEIAGRSSDLVALDMNGSDRTISSKSVIPAEDLDLRGVSDPRDDRTAGDESDSEVMEIDAVELLAEHVHFCEICGKGFKRDANLRMHMRAHGNRFKTLEALSKPDQRFSDDANRFKITRFACPVIGCNRNRAHSRFRPLKSVICVKNHFKRSHCPKMYSCNRCNKKSFSVLADLKSHMKHCGESRWRCSCGTSFSRKDKLFGHVALFEGHMPAFMGEDEVEGKGKVAVVGEEEEEERGGVEAVGNGGLDAEFFDGFMVGFESGDGWCLDGIL